LLSAQYALRASHSLAHFSPTKALLHREAKQFVQDHIANEQQTETGTQFSNLKCCPISKGLRLSPGPSYKGEGPS
jgi:hypothetical protein